MRVEHGDSAPERMTPIEAEKYILSLLRANGPMTTTEIEELANRERRRCPDQTVLFLAKLEQKGIVQGEVSIERKGWIWRLPSRSDDP